jgi:CheY-like chemotaxis protein
VSAPETRTLKVLWLRSGEQNQPELADLLGADCRIDFVDTVESAAQALRREPFDLVVSGSADFLPLERIHTRPEAEVILETVSQGVCIVGRSGELVWANPKMLSFPQELRNEVCRRCRETFPSATGADVSASPRLRGRRFSIATGDGHYFEITATPVIDLNNQVTQVAAVVWDATRALRLQERIDAIDNAGRELVQLDAEQITRLNAHERLALLEQKTIRYMHDLMEMENFTVYLLDKRTNKLELVLSAGMPLEAQNTDLYASPEGNGISGYVAHRGRSYLCPDVRNDPRYLPGIPQAASCLAVPLRLHDKVIGVFNVESDQPAAFGEDDRQTLEIFSRYVAMSLHIFELLNTERSTTTGRLGSDVMAEITAPVNEILTEVEKLIEDYIGHDDLRHRLNKISSNAVDIRDSIKQVTTPGRGLVGRCTPAATRLGDPVLKGKRMLIVDDEDVIRETVRDVLSSYGCVVTVACDGDEAIKLLGQMPFDVVLSDIKMPGANGYEVFSAAKDAAPDCPVILMTGFGYDPNHSIIRARREGLAAVLFKPFKVDQLLGEIRNAVRSSPAAAG